MLKAILSVGVNICLIVLAISAYKSWQQLAKLETQLISLTNLAKSLEARTTQIETNYSNQSKQIQRLVSQTSVLEASLGGVELRWARIRKVRSAIKKISTRNLPVEELTEIATSIVDRGDEYDVPASLILAVMRQESDFNKEAISLADARGLMQVLPSTATDVQNMLSIKTYSYNRPSHNIRFGVFYLARMLHSFRDDQELAVAAYNAGQVLVERVRSGKFGDYPVETKDYIQRVKLWKSAFEAEGITW